MNSIRHVLSTSTAKCNAIAPSGIRFGHFSTRTSLAVVFERNFLRICKSRRGKQTASIQPRIRQPDRRRRKLKHLKNKWFQLYIHRWGSRCLLFQPWRTLHHLSFLDLARAHITNRLMHMQPMSCMRYPQASYSQFCLRARYTTQ